MLCNEHWWELRLEPMFNSEVVTVPFLEVNALKIQTKSAAFHNRGSVFLAPKIPFKPQRFPV